MRNVNEHNFFLKNSIREIVSIQDQILKLSS